MASCGSSLHYLATGLACVALSLSTTACSDDPQVLSIEVTTGHESDAFSQNPAVNRVDIWVRSNDGTALASASTSPGGQFDLGEVDNDVLLYVDVAGSDATGAARVSGRSLAVVPSAMETTVISVFAQRLGQWARPPEQLTHTHVGPVAGVIGERYLLVAGGTALSSDGSDYSFEPAYYDLLSLGAATGLTLPRVAESLVAGADGASALLIDSNGATWIDYDQTTSTEATTPAGLASFAEVAGGDTIVRSDGTAYVVGATRLDVPSAAILVVATDGSLSAASLVEARADAAATWVEGIGLVVAGGSATAAGVEILADGQSLAAARDYPPDPTRGAAAVTYGSGQNIALLGGELAGKAAPLRVVDPNCLDECTVQQIDLSLGPQLRHCRAYSFGNDRVLVVGDDASRTASGLGMTRSIAVDLVAQSAEERLLREPRSGARAVPTPNGMLALVGGQHQDGSGAYTIELFVTESL